MDINSGNPRKQLVTIDTGMAYEWNGEEPLKIGDKVRLPGNWTTGGQEFIGEVTLLKSNWAGRHVSILGRA